MEDNAPGCNTQEEIEAGCEGIAVLATVRLDYNGDCHADTSDGHAEGILLRLSGPIQQVLRPTQSDGTAHFGYLDSGPFSLSLPQLPTQNWAICQDTFWFQADTIQDTLRATFLLKPLNQSTDGSTYRMEATKYDNGTLTATALENCGGFTPGFITAYWLHDGLRNYDFDCREIRNAYDPNQKTAIPTGVGPEHLLTANRPIQYTIDFQNTGTDTAFRVLLRDILPNHLNVSTFRPGFASHPYHWEIRGGDTLEVLFFPIMLPDSNVNEADSHGWFSFEIAQKPDLPDGTTIENTASIVFDYNPPIVTNTVRHTIGQLTVSVDGPQPAGTHWQVFPNPARYTATFRALDVVAGEKRFELSDALGRVVRTERFDGQAFEFQRGNLPGGLYYFRIVDARGRTFSGKIVLPAS